MSLLVKKDSTTAEILPIYLLAGTPALDLQFAFTKSLTDYISGTDLITFTRASSGTFVGSTGTLQTAVTNVPRFDHNPTTGESLGLLVEEQRTNTILQSNQFNTAWSPSTGNPTISLVTQTAPDGVTQSWKFVEGTTNGSQSLLQTNVSFSAGMSAYSVYVKAAERFKVSLRESITTGATVLFDVSNGTVLSTTGTGTPSGQITPAGNGWYRCTMFLTQASTANRSARIFVVADATTTAVDSYADRTGDGTSGILIYGAQLEAGAFPTSYIPTTTAAATRSADVASITGANFSSWYRQDEGTVFVETAGVPANATIYNFHDGTSNNRIIAGYSADTVVQWRINNGGVDQWNANITALASRATLRHILSYKTNDFAGCANGGALQLDTLGSVPTTSSLALGMNVNSVGQLNGTIRRLVYWGQRLPNNVLQAITQ